MLLNQQHQADIDGITPMPTDRVDDTSVVNSSTSEAVVWYYSNSGVWGAASGQAAGTICYAKLTYSGVTNAMGSAIGNYYDTSLSFAAATRASTLVLVPEEAFSKMESMSVTNKVAYIATWLDTNGDYAIDHRRGAVWLKTKADPTNDSATYKYQTPLSGGGAGDKVDVIKIAGTSVSAKNDAYAEAPLGTGLEFEALGALTTDGGTAGDKVPAKGSATGIPYSMITAPDGSVAAQVLSRTTGSETPADTDDALVVYDVGSGGSSSTLVATHQSPADGTVTYTSNVTITCSDFPFTVSDSTCTVVYVLYKPSGGEWQSPLVQGAGGVSLTASANVITVAGAGTPFASGDTYVVGIQYQRKPYDSANSADRIGEINPIDSHYIDGAIDVDTTNVAAAATYYPSSTGIAIDGQKNFSLTGKYVDGDAVTTTLSVQGTNDEDSTNADWVNIEGQINGLASATAAIPTVTGTVSGVTGVAVVPGTVCDLITTAAAQTVKFTWDFDKINYRYLRVVLTPGDATNTAILKGRFSPL